MCNTSIFILFGRIIQKGKFGSSESIVMFISVFSGIFLWFSREAVEASMVGLGIGRNSDV